MGNEQGRHAGDVTALQDDNSSNRPDHPAAIASEAHNSTSDAAGASLTLYDSACRALADACAVDEVKDIHDQAVALREYARRAKNDQLQRDAVALRMNAERRLGQLIEAQKHTIGLNEGGRPKTGFSENPVSKPTLASQGIDKNLAQRARALAALSEEQFTQRVAEARDSVNRVVPRVVNAVIADQKRATYRKRTYRAETLSHPAPRPTPELSTTQTPERELPQVSQEPQVYAPSMQPPPPQIQSALLPPAVDPKSEVVALRRQLAVANKSW
jgi:hypothetical protein